MEDSEPAPRIGGTIAGKYAISRQIGEGGMGVVYEAEHLVTHRRVALKLMRADQRWTKQSVERFLREAVLTTAISHPNIVDVLDAGTDDDGTPYITLEFLRGASIATLLGHRERLPLAEACWVAAEVLAGLAASHAIGIVHRDVKPENVFVADTMQGERRVKLLDFGISRVFADPGGSGPRPMTRAGRILGTTEYMSPEQLRAEVALDGRTDLWSLGVMLYEMITGSRPFDGSNATMVSVHILSTAHTPLRERAKVPRALSDLVDRALEKDRDRRFLSATDMQAELLPLIRLLPTSPSAPPLPHDPAEVGVSRLAPVTSFPVPVSHQTASSAAPTVLREPPVGPPAARRSRLVWLAAVVVGAILVAGVVSLAARRPERPPVTSAPAPAPVRSPAPVSPAVPSVVPPMVPPAVAPSVVPPAVAPAAPVTDTSHLVVREGGHAPVRRVRRHRHGHRPPEGTGPAGPVRSFDGL